MLSSIRRFWLFFIGSWLIFIILLPIVNITRLYEQIPVIAVIVYALMILLNLLAITESVKRHDYIILSASLIIIGLVASVDIISNKEEMVAIWVKALPMLSTEVAEDYVQVLIILLNIFTGSIAAQSLFHGLNKRTFNTKK